MIRFYAFLYFLFLGAEAFSAQYVTMDQTVVIPVSLSSRNHNRIGIIGERIKKAFFRSNNISVDVEEESGQIFVQPVRPNCPETTISIVSVSGVVQELELHFVDIPSEVVLLQPVFIDCQSSTFPSSLNVTSFATQDSFSITNLVRCLIKGVIPEGYQSVPDQETSKICKGLKLQRIYRLLGNEQIVFVYKVQNVSSKLKQITECQLNILDGDWVFLDRYQLKPDESALLLIGCFR